MIIDLNHFMNYCIKFDSDLYYIMQASDIPVILFNFSKKLGNSNNKT